MVRRRPIWKFGKQTVPKKRVKALERGMENGVILRDVVKPFGEVTVIPDLNLEISEGEFTVRVGPSGCGSKSTTLRMIASEKLRGQVRPHERRAP